ncbi:uncharacterized protein CTHT_0050610 [Thermochaetoides thermophila DSM 1495]|uniref:DUF8021 domain-containing protein n=1 Tax=Chaetomium thermophilum (strain DSM 1495 / CBS 144.50 / IMI 039719) TaxID=759272 RepID=G0SD30_CHATD|nr:hypothetical protein CTHT_0050610 [Thermochaetoides thermophila DSM 1495]EGS18460.1 hypothetical protein CTHT_0050610 [Thermochaetoides thermophila DSM 1495]
MPEMLSILVFSIITPVVSFAGNCTREFLKTSADSLVAAQTAGNPELLQPKSNNFEYHENFAEASFTAGILSSPLKVDHNRHSLDTTQCATYTEIVSATGSKPYVIGVQMYFTDNVISKVATLITTTGDWLFNATGTLYWASREDWSTIPEEKRDSRDVIQAAAEAYLNLFSDNSTVVPWGYPCSRLEGGMYTGNGGPNDRCDVGIPSGVSLVSRRYVIDETAGAVSVFLSFSGLPDSHEFRIEGGKLRYVHTITVLSVRANGKEKMRARKAMATYPTN